MRWTPHLNTITSKRWQRFRRLRRAWWSLLLLLILYGMSLAANLLCSNTPLYLRYNGRSYFPAFRYYPESAFLANGKHTRPDYKALVASPTFSSNAANVAIFPPIPFGPNEIIAPEAIGRRDAVTLVFSPLTRIGTLSVRADMTVDRATDLEFFFGQPDDRIGGMLLPAPLGTAGVLSDGLARRFRNEASPAVETTVRSKSGMTWIASLSEYRPRSNPPSSVRITLREVLSADAHGGSVTFDEESHVTSAAFPAWERLPPPLRAHLTDLARARASSPVDKQTVTVEGRTYEATFETSDVRWPYPPVAGHWMGIDTAGRDVLARVLYGLRISLTFGLLLVAVSMILGVALGAAQGYFGGRTDIAGQRLTEIWSALPFLYIMILLGSVYGRGFLLLLFCYAIFNWIGISYYIRGEFLRLRHLPFVEAARATGLPHTKIVFRHILPNALVPIITFFPFYLMGAIGVLAALDFLGFGLPPPTPSWGELLQQAHQFRWAWWLILFPSLALFSVMLLCVFIGEGVRDAYDPRPVSRMQ